MNRSHLVRQLTLAAASAVALTCSEPAGPDVARETTRLNINRRAWQRLDVDDYAYTLRVGCFCGPEVTRPVVVTVRDGVRQSVVYEDDGTPVDAAYLNRFPTIGGLFDIVDDAIERRAHRLDVTYHPALGYPTSIGIDYELNAADEELYLYANDVRVLEASPLRQTGSPRQIARVPHR